MADWPTKTDVENRLLIDIDTSYDATITDITEEAKAQVIKRIGSDPTDDVPVLLKKACLNLIIYELLKYNPQLYQAYINRISEGDSSIQYGQGINIDDLKREAKDLIEEYMPLPFGVTNDYFED